jgi:hypothetical protein
MAKPALRHFEATSPEAKDPEYATPKTARYRFETAAHDGMRSRVADSSLSFTFILLIKTARLAYLGSSVSVFE